jgi:hypothetical protein
MTISALYLGFPIFANTPMSEAILKVIIANIIWIPGHLLWLYAGVRVNCLNLSERTTRLLNISLASAMLLIVFVSAILSIFE